MPARIKKIALVLLIAALPLQALAAIVMPLCRQDVAAASAHDHAHHDGHQHDHGAPAQDHDHPLKAGDLGSDHCSAESAIAPPAAPFGWAGGPAVQRYSFAFTRCSSFVPEQPQRPPLV
jgi:hypothetical protein